MQSNVIAMKHREAVSGSRPLAPMEAKWIHQAEMDASVLVRDWHTQTNAVRNQVNQVDHALRDKLAEYETAHRLHRDKEYARFHPKYPQVLYWPLLGLAALLETPLNNSALGLLNMDESLQDHGNLDGGRCDRPSQHAGSKFRRMAGAAGHSQCCGNARVAVRSGDPQHRNCIDVRNGRNALG